MSIPNWWGDWRQGLTPHTGNLQSTDLIECTMIVGGQPVNTVITGAQILGAVPSGGGLTVGTTAIASGTVGRILFEGTGNVLQQSANLFWDNTNSRLGIGTASPSATLHTVGSITASGAIARGNYMQPTLVAAANNDTLVGLDIAPTFTNGAFTGVTNLGLRVTGNTRLDGVNSSAYAFSVYSSNTLRFGVVGFGGVEMPNGFNVVSSSTDLTTTRLRIGTSNATAPINIRAQSGNTDMIVLKASNGVDLFTIKQSTGNALIGTSTDAGFKLHVNGTARVVNNIFSGNGTYFTTGSQSIASASTSNAYVEISSGASSSGALVWSKAGALSTLWQLYSDSSNNIAFFRNGVNREILKIFESTKNVGIDETSGSASFTDITSAKLFVNSTTKGFLPPRMTTTQKNAIASPAAGLVVYDTTLNKLCVRTASAWETITSI